MFWNLCIYPRKQRTDFCGIVFVTIMTDFINEHIKEIFKNILYFIVGVLIVAVPVCLFFLIKGTLSDMLFSTFVFNFLYASEGSSEKTSSAILLLLRWVAPVLMMISYRHFLQNDLVQRLRHLSQQYPYSHWYLYYSVSVTRIITQRLYL